MRISSMAVALAAVVSAPLGAQQHPDFSGTWVLDVLNSPSSQMMPSAATMTVVQRGDTITSDNKSSSTMGGDQTTHMVMTTDGKPWKNTISIMGQDVDLNGVSTWSHDTLVTKITGSVQGTDFSEDETMVLAPDGKTLTSMRKATFGGAEQPPLTMVFGKQS